MAQSSVKARKKTWSIWTERRVPSEYEVVTHKLHYHFRRAPAPFELDPAVPLAAWYLKYREGSPFNVEDWEGFRDPDRLTYRAYILLQKDRETYLDALIDEFEARDHYAKLSPSWVALLEKLYIPSRFSGHVLQIVAFYVAQMAPSSYITNTAYFQGADEMRRVQSSAYVAKALSLDHGEHLADSLLTRKIWEDDPAWQPLREALERLLVAYDWGEAFTALNLVIKPSYDALFCNECAQLARTNGDELLALMGDEFAQDAARSRRWTSALVRYALERKPGLEGLLREWIHKWTPLAHAGVEGLANLFALAPSPLDPAHVMAGVRAEHRNFLGELGLA
jgi:toluene monooxygenase system protein E